MIPPTSGCNGLWVLQDSMWQYPCTYTHNPPMCLTFNHRNGDSLFLNLCSIPCDYFESCNQYGSFWAWLKLETGFSIVNENYFKIYSYNQTIFIDNPDLNIECVELLDMNGKIINITNACDNLNIMVQVMNKSKGLYVVNCKLKDKMTFTKLIELN